MCTVVVDFLVSLSIYHLFVKSLCAGGVRFITFGGRQRSIHHTVHVSSVCSIGVQASTCCTRTQESESESESGQTSEQYFQVHSSLILKLLGSVVAGHKKLPYWQEETR